MTKSHVAYLEVRPLASGTPPRHGPCRVTHAQVISSPRGLERTWPQHRIDLMPRHVRFSQGRRCPSQVREVGPLFSDFPDGGSRAHAEEKLSLCYGWFEVT